MPLIEPIIRPPAEADSLLLQITVGCSANTCTFCGAYLNKPFRTLNYQTIESDIIHASQRFPKTRRIFLLDGDALVLNNTKMIPILKCINQNFPKLTRIASYANGYNITARTDEELKELFLHKLTLAYMGLESGSQFVLDQCQKKSNAEEMITAVQRLDSAGIKTSVIVLLGLGGKQYSNIHVDETIIALNKMQPRYLSFLSLMLINGTPLDKMEKEGTFEELHSQTLLQESHDIIQGLELEKTIFRSNHASNYLPLEGRLPKDKNNLLQTLKAAIKGNISLRSEFFRGL